MNKLSDLYDIHAGADIYIIGTGASFRVFPRDFFENKITIGLNRAWELLDVDYVISMVPHLNFPEFLGSKRSLHTKWVTKRDKYNIHADAMMINFAEQNYYFFRTDGQSSITELDEPSEAGRVLDWVENPNNEFLYLWTSISQTAVNLAANMGAKNIILVGCDNCALSGNHHAHNQHTLWKGVDPDDRYMQYYLGLKEVRHVLHLKYINVLSLTPFLKLDNPELDFVELCNLKEQPNYIENVDIYRPTSLYQNNIKFIKIFINLMKKNLNFVKSSLKRLMIF